MLQFIWYYSTRWFSISIDFLIQNYEVWVIFHVFASNFLKLEIGWAIVVKYATTVI